MKKPTLAEFIALGKKHGRANLHIQEPGFKFLYLRYGRRWFDKVYDPVLDIANAEVHREKSGTLSRFVQKLRDSYPELSLYAENVREELHDYFLRIGFEIHPQLLNCFFLRSPLCSESTSTIGTPEAATGSS